MKQLRILFLFSLLLTMSTGAQAVENKNLPISKINGEDYYIYQVEPSEGLYRISVKFGVSQEDITRMNPSVTDGLKVGQFLLIPVTNNTTAIEAIKENTRREDRSLLTEVNVAVILPFMLHLPNDPKGALYLEFYEGLLLAVDSLQRAGARINIYAYDTELSDKRVQAILSEDALEKMNLIIVPAEDNHIEVITTFAKSKKIPVVSAFSLRSNEVNTYENFYQLNVGHPDLYSKVNREFVRRFGGWQIIFLTDTQEPSDKRDYALSLQEKLRDKKIAFKEIPINSESTLQFLDTLALGNERIVIVPTARSLNSLTQLIPPLRRVKEGNPSMRLSLWGYPEWQTMTKDFIDSFYALNTLFFSRFYTVNSDKKVIAFNDKFKYWFSKEMINAAPRYALMGYDTGLFFIRNVAQWNNDLPAQIQHLESQSLQTDFQFKRVYPKGGFVNNSIYLVSFGDDYSIGKKIIK